VYGCADLPATLVAFRDCLRTAYSARHHQRGRLKHVLVPVSWIAAPLFASGHGLAPSPDGGGRADTDPAGDTHHLPTPKSVPQRFARAALNAFFVSDMTSYLRELQPKLAVAVEVEDAVDRLAPLSLAGSGVEDLLVGIVMPTALVPVVIPALVFVGLGDVVVQELDQREEGDLVGPLNKFVVVADPAVPVRRKKNMWIVPWRPGVLPESVQS
jgi:hypothetical protein